MQLNDIGYVFKDFLSMHFQSRRETSSADPDWYYFLHIPKTGGTTFRYCLYNYFSPRIIYPNSLDFFLKQNGCYLEWPQFKADLDHYFSTEKKVLIGHYGIAPLSQLRASRPKTLSIFRDPKTRFISSLQYHLEPGRRYHGKSVDQILAENGSAEGNMQARSLGYRPKRENINHILDRLHSLDVICIFEEFDRSLEVVNRKLGWSLQPTPPRNAAKNKIELSNSQLDHINSLCMTDYLVYKECLEIFSDQCL